MSDMWKHELHRRMANRARIAVLLKERSTLERLREDLSEDGKVEEAFIAADMRRLLREKGKSQRSGTAAAFLALLDRTGGPDACHPWQGARLWNHDESYAIRYERGHFHINGLNSTIASRIVSFVEYGESVPRSMDVHPDCGNHLCCNVKHLSVRPHGRRGAGTKMTQYFAAGV